MSTVETMQIFGSFKIAPSNVAKALNIEEIEPIYTMEDIKNDKYRIIQGYANTPDEDRVRDRVAPTAFQKSLPVYKTNPMLRYNHQAGEVVGKILEVEVHEGKGLWVVAQIGTGDKADDIWLKIRNKELRGFSVYGVIKEKSIEQTMDGKRVQHVSEFDLQEIAIVDIPANHNSLFEISKKSVDTMTVAKDKIEQNVSEVAPTEVKEVGNEQIRSDDAIMKRLDEVYGFQQKQLEVLVNLAETQNEMVKKMLEMSAAQPQMAPEGGMEGEDEFADDEEFDDEEEEIGLSAETESGDLTVKGLVTIDDAILKRFEEIESKLAEKDKIIEDLKTDVVTVKSTETKVEPTIARDINVEEAVSKAVRGTEEDAPTAKSADLEAEENWGHALTNMLNAN